MWLGVIFDLDGTLADTDLLWERAKAKTFDDCAGRRRPVRLRGASLGTTAEALARIAGSPRADLVERALLAHLMDGVRNSEVVAMPGALALVKSLQTRGIPVAVASASPSELVDAVLEQIGLDIPVAVGAGPRVRPKPSPDAYLEACARLRHPPSALIAVEDSDTGVAAASAAGLSVIAVGEHVTRESHWRLSSLTDRFPYFGAGA